MATNDELVKSEYWKKKFRQRMEMRDVNKSGTLSRSDFEALVEGFRKIHGNSEKVKTMSERLLKHCDKIGLINDSVEMTYEEYKQRWLTLTDREEYREILQALFEILDMKGRGKICIEKWKTHTEALNVPPERVKATFDAIDTNRDGKITKEDFVASQMDFFFSTEDKLNGEHLFGTI